MFKTIKWFLPILGLVAATIYFLDKNAGYEKKLQCEYIGSVIVIGCR